MVSRPFAALTRGAEDAERYPRISKEFVFFSAFSAPLREIAFDLNLTFFGR
jgi:hypothetical protein